VGHAIKHYNILKRALFIILLLVQAAVFTAKAQIGYNYPQWGLGTGIAYGEANTGVLHQSWHNAYNFNLTYNVTPYVNVAVDYSFGKLSGGYFEYYPGAAAALDPTNAKYDSLLLDIPVQYKKLDPYLRNYTNNYQMLSLHADMQLGEILDYGDGGIIKNIAKGVYIGTGLGLVFNSISDNNNRLSPDSTYYIGGSDNSQNVVIPLRIGYKYQIYNNYDMPTIELEVGYQHNWVLGYGLDGYADPVVITKKFEQSQNIHFGIKFFFGNITSYRKPLH